MKADEAKIVARLVHNVGKYVSRGARNLPKGEISDSLGQMLVEDLFKTDGFKPASQVFEELVAQSDTLAGNARIQKCRALLAGIDRMRSEVEKGDDGAMRRAAAMACEVDETLRALFKGKG